MGQFPRIKILRQEHLFASPPEETNDDKNVHICLLNFPGSHRDGTLTVDFCNASSTKTKRTVFHDFLSKTFTLISLTCTLKKLVQVEMKKKLAVCPNNLS